MSDPEYLKDLSKERYELGEMEREVERTAQFTTHGGFWWRLLTWMAGKIRADRDEVEAEIARERGRE